jgi:hypothetical protein
MVLDYFHIQSFLPYTLIQYPRFTAAKKKIEKLKK